MREADSFRELKISAQNKLKAAKYYVPTGRMAPAARHWAIRGDTHPSIPFLPDFYTPSSCLLFSSIPSFSGMLFCIIFFFFAPCSLHGGNHCIFPTPPPAWWVSSFMGYPYLSGLSPPFFFFLFLSGKMIFIPQKKKSPRLTGSGRGTFTRHDTKKPK